jgi:hypothetical protein
MCARRACRFNSFSIAAAMNLERLPFPTRESILQTTSTGSLTAVIWEARFFKGAFFLLEPELNYIPPSGGLFGRITVSFLYYF